MTTNLPAFPPEPPPLSEHPSMGGREGMVLPIILFIASVVFWESAVLAPIKYLTVFFHEFSHGLAAVLSGGSMHQIVLTQDQGGVCWTAGGNRFVILTAGYLGSLLWGGALFAIAAKTRYDRETVKAVGVILIAVTVIYIRNIFGFMFGAGFGIGLLAFSHYFGEPACDQFLRYIGLTSMFYVILDIKSDLLDRSIAKSDASVLGAMFGLPGWFVGGIWFLAALYFSYRIIRWSFND